MVEYGGTIWSIIKGVWPPPRIPVANDFRLNMKKKSWWGMESWKGGHGRGAISKVYLPT